MKGVTANGILQAYMIISAAMLAALVVGLLITIHNMSQLKDSVKVITQQQGADNAENRLDDISNNLQSVSNKVDEANDSLSNLQTSVDDLQH